MLGGGKMPVIAIFALIDAEMSVHMVIILSNRGGELGFFAGFIANFMSFADPTALWLVNSGF